MLDLAPFIEKIKDKILLSTLISADVKLVRQGQNMGGLCPFHKEKSPSFTVNDKKGFYHCFGCGAHGDVISYLTDAKRYTFHEAVEYLAAKAGVQLPKDSKILEKDKVKQDNLLTVIETASNFFQENLKTTMGEKAREYLEERGVLQSTVYEFQVGFAAKSMLLYNHLKSKGFSDEAILESGLVVTTPEGVKKNRFYERIIFPIWNEKGKNIAFGARTLLKDVMPKYINSSDSSIFHKSQVLYNFHRAKNFVDDNTPFIVTEGYLDVMLMHQEGIKTSVATLGTAVSEHHLQLIWRRNSKPIFCFDGDQAGYKAALRTIKIALPIVQSSKTIRFAFLPSGEDPASMIQNKRTQELQSILLKPMALNDVIKKEVASRLALAKSLEEKAEVKKYISELVSVIKDVDLQKLYAYDVYQEFDELVKLSYHENKRYKKTVSSSISVRQKALVTKKNVISQKILLATLINHPTLINELHEFFIQIAFDNEIWNNMRDVMLSYDEEKNTKLLDFLVKNNLESAVKEIYDSKVFLYAPFAKESADQETAKKGWLDVWHHVVWQNEVRNDFNKIKNHVKASMSEEDWQKLKIAKLNLKKNEVE